jgi:hypothetical protein
MPFLTEFGALSVTIVLREAQVADLQTVPTPPA